MSHPYNFLPLHKIKAGMVLSDDLLDKLGHILLPAGTILTGSMINSMPHHDIHQLSILFKNAVVSEEDILIERQKKLARLKQIFRQAPNESPANTLLAYVEKYRSDFEP
jgi:hypothetical protein